jgi:hypothetical protein
MRIGFREIGSFLWVFIPSLCAVLITSAGVYYVFYAEKEVQRNVLESALDLMGNKLIAMVPDGAEKDKISELYADLKQKTLQDNVAPERLEYIAANILNASNSQTSLTAQEAEQVISFKMIAKRPKVVTGLHSEGIEIKTPQEVRRHNPEDWEVLGKRVKTMFELNEHLNDATKRHAKIHRENVKRIHFRVRGGLTVALDTSFRAYMNKKEFVNLAKELTHLEERRLLDWQDNLSVHLEREIKVVRVEAVALRESIQKLKEYQIFEGMETLESLVGLEHLKQISAVDLDSIRKVVEERLREAGIRPQNKPSTK